MLDAFLVTPVGPVQNIQLTRRSCTLGRVITAIISRRDRLKGRRPVAHELATGAAPSSRTAQRFALPATDPSFTGDAIPGIADSALHLLPRRLGTMFVAIPIQLEIGFDSSH